MHANKNVTRSLRFGNFPAGGDAEAEKHGGDGCSSRYRNGLLANGEYAVEDWGRRIARCGYLIIIPSLRSEAISSIWKDYFVAMTVAVGVITGAAKKLPAL